MNTYLLHDSVDSTKLMQNEVSDAASVIINQVDTIDKLLFGVLVGLISTFVYYLFSQIFKPRIKISKKISIENDGIYRIKFINKTFFNIEKIDIGLFLMKQYTADENGNMDYTLKKLNLHTPEYTFIKGSITREKKVHNNCIQVSVVENLSEVWNNIDDILIFQVTSHHSFSGNRRISRRRFRHPPSTLVNGMFKSGNTMEIVNNS